jgi:hypothetical protein
MDQFRFFKPVVQSNGTSLGNTKECAVKRMGEGPDAEANDPIAPQKESE